MLALQIALAALCVVWLLQAVACLAHLGEIRTLSRLDPPRPEHWPRVSAIVPIRDEADDIGAALRTRLTDGYPDLEIVAVDDRSADATPDVLAELARSDGRVRVVRIDELPAGWLGKTHALHRGIEAATGEWLLVSDADIHFAPDALAQAVALAQAERLDFIALVPEFRSASPAVDVLWAVFTRVLATMVSPNKVRDPESRVAMGSGAFMLARRSVFDRTPGYEHLRMETTDDIALGVMMKQAGARCEFINGLGSARVSIYDHLGEFYRGIEKNAGSLATTPLPLVLCALLAAGAVELSPLAALAVGAAEDVAWLTGLGALAAVAATTSTVAALHKNTGMVWPALLWPVGWLLVASGVMRAAWLAHRRGGIVWRDTFYPAEEIRRGQRFKLF